MEGDGEGEVEAVDDEGAIHNFMLALGVGVGGMMCFYYESLGDAARFRYRSGWGGVSTCSGRSRGLTRPDHQAIYILLSACRVAVEGFAYAASRGCRCRASVPSSSLSIATGAMEGIAYAALGVGVSGRESGLDGSRERA